MRGLRLFIIVLGINLALLTLIVAVAYDWIVPFIFKGAVQQGLMVRYLDWYTAFKVALIIMALYFTKEHKK